MFDVLFYCMLFSSLVRVLYESGLQTAADVSEQDEVTIMDILKRSRPFDMRNVDESIANYQEKLELRCQILLLLMEFLLLLIPKDCTCLAVWCARSDFESSEAAGERSRNCEESA
jgi:hypothetical protein